MQVKRVETLNLLILMFFTFPGLPVPIDKIYFHSITIVSSGAIRRILPITFPCLLA